MIKIWAKIFKDHRIRESVVYEADEVYHHSDLFRHLREICEMLDIPTPLLTKTNVLNYAKFHFTKFNAEDFVESVNFDYLQIENIEGK